MSLARRNSFDSKTFINLEALRRYEIGSLFVHAMSEAGDRSRELVDYYRDCRKRQEDMLYEIQKDLLNAWPEE